MYPFHKITLALVVALVLTGLLAMAPANVLAVTCAEWHLVHEGESLDTIGRDYGISRAELVALNKLSSSRRVTPGTQLCVDAGANPAATYDYSQSSVHSSAQPDPRTRYYAPYYQGSDPACQYPPEYGCEPQYDHDQDWDCDGWYDQDACFNGEETWHDCNWTDGDSHGCRQDYHHCYYSDDGIRDWNFSVVRVRQDRDVTIQANSFPHDSTFEVEMRYDGGRWVYSDQLNGGGSFRATVPIPHQVRGYSPLTVRVTKYPDAITDLETFYNYSFTESTSTRCGGKYAKHAYPYRQKYEGIPTIRIESVRRNKTVTFRTHNFPAQLEFNVYMGKMGTKGKGGYYAGDFYSGSGGSFFVTVDIPPELKGVARIAIRMESTEKGYYSYNWFDNKNAN